MVIHASTSHIKMDKMMLKPNKTASATKLLRSRREEEGCVSFI